MGRSPGRGAPENGSAVRAGGDGTAEEQHILEWHAEIRHPATDRVRGGGGGRGEQSERGHAGDKRPFD
ncbi:hypothetical protein GCM10012278_79250 [Nonomuraea glycinis]|uniref:Uncharacterized protein n=1 Tax=Nonomuraea glycinis TaxID=2047744 RepID=A0A918AGN6_9ACTN|nr:hypothetical protein GCM10012278_79250 [Nonomuraea glycinis]